MNRWRESLAAALKWRERSPNDTLLPDLAIAEAYVRIGEANNAVRQLEPHITAAKLQPDANRSILVIQARSLILAHRESEAAALLQPLIEQSSAWRAAWLELAGSVIHNPATGVQWIDTVAPLIPPDSLNEQLQLANAWHQLGQRSHTDEYFRNARKILLALGDRINDNAGALLLLAVSTERLGDLPQAEQHYRKALAAQPDQPVAMNNLAYLLFKTRDDLTEARELASRAVSAAPNQASFLDTLARIQSRLGDRAAAVSTFERARTLEPDNVEILIGYADALVQAGRRDQAMNVLSTIDLLIRTHPLNNALKEQLNALRAAIQGSAEAR